MRMVFGLTISCLLFALIGCGKDNEDNNRPDESSVSGSEDSAGGKSGLPNAGGEGGNNIGGIGGDSGGDGGGGTRGGGYYDEVTTDAPPEIECTEDEFTCRGACFRDIGDLHNGCELFAVSDDESSDFDSLAVDDSSIFVVDNSDPDRLLRIDKTSGSIKILTDEIYLDDRLIVYKGYLYFAANRTIDVSPDCLVRIPTEGGEVELIYDAYDPVSDTKFKPNFEIIDDNVYVVSSDVDTIRGMIRIPLSGGVAETVIDDHVIRQVAADDTYFYFHVGYPDFNIQRSRRANPNVMEIVYEDTSIGVVWSVLFLEPTDPDYLHIFDNRYRRVLKTGGSSQLLIDREFDVNSALVGSQYLLIRDRRSDLSGAFAIRRGGSDVLVIDNKTYESIAEDATHFYLLDTKAIFRTVKPGT